MVATWRWRLFFRQKGRLCEEGIGCRGDSWVNRLKPPTPSMPGYVSRDLFFEQFAQPWLAKSSNSQRGHGGQISDPERAPRFHQRRVRRWRRRCWRWRRRCSHRCRARRGGLSGLKEGDGRIGEPRIVPTRVENEPAGSSRGLPSGARPPGEELWPRSSNWENAGSNEDNTG